MSPEAYFAWEADQPDRHEFYDGEVFAMAGGTERHAAITANVVIELGTRLRARGCRPYTSDLRVQLAAERRYVYPDFTAVCGEPEFLDDDRLTLLNPTLVVEVLSSSTADFDRGTKALWYRALPSLESILIVAQDAPAVTAYRRDGDHWRTDDVTGLGATVDALGEAVELADLYRDVTFESEPDAPDPDEADREAPAR